MTSHIPEHRFGISLALAGLALLTGACNSGDSETNSTAGSTEAEPAELLSTIVADRFVAPVGSPFELSVVRDDTLVGPVDFSWDLGPAGLATTETVSAIFAESGFFDVQVTITEIDGEQRTSVASTTLLAIDTENPTGIFDEGLVTLPGDIDGDEVLSLGDALSVSQHLSSLNVFSEPEQIRRADFDRDGDVTDVDLELLSRALLEGTNVPRALVPEAVMPGQVLAVFSPELLDPEPIFQVRIGNGPIFEPVRVVGGQLNFFVPLDVLTPGVLTELGGTTSVELLRDGALVDTFALEVLDAPAIPADPLSEIRTLLGGLPELRAQTLSDLEAFFAAPDLETFGFTPNDGVVLCGMFEVSTARLNEMEASLLAALESLGDTERDLIARITYANGFGASDLGLASLSGTTSQLLGNRGGVVVGNATLGLLCQVEDFAERLEDANEDVGILCVGLGALFVGSLGVGIIFPGAFVITAPALAAFQGCASALVTAELAQTVLSLVPDVGDRIRLEPDGPTTVAPGETIRLLPSIQLTGLDDFCTTRLVGAEDGELIEELLAEPITALLLKKFPLRPVYDLVRRISRDAAEELEEVVEDVVEAALNATPLGGYVGNLAERLCGALFSNVGIFVPLDPGIVEMTAEPSGGSLGFDNDAVLFTCDAASTEPESILLSARIELCAREATGQITVSCGEEVDVTITMGDNGSLLDDIFEVVVDGQSVLTSSAPVTSISTTIQLTSGAHTLRMNGLAAPDFVGTYFINVFGASLENGPPLSGSDLVAGASFTWDLIVP